MRYLRLPMLSALLLMPVMAWAKPPCAFQAPQHLDLDLSGVHTVRFDIGSDDLHVDGQASGSQLAIRGRACASSQKALATLHLTHQREGDTLVVRSVHDLGRRSPFGDRYAYMDVRVHLPRQIAVVLDAGSGDSWLRGLSRVNGRVGSGDVAVTGVTGAVALSTGSGDLDITDVGALHVSSAGSGDLRVQRVRGAVEVGRVGAGDVHLSRVGSVDIGHVGSGDLELRQVTGDVHVGHVGSGDIEADDIGGALRVDSRGSGDITHHHVRGAVDIPRDED